MLGFMIAGWTKIEKKVYTLFTFDFWLQIYCFHSIKH